jgi:hypothetical protein
VSRENGELHLLWSQVFSNGGALGEVADMKLREFRTRGWELVCDDTHRAD